MHDNPETLIEFPCEFAIKAMGKNNQALQAEVISICKKHAPDLTEGAIKMRPSKGDKWLSITITITATSKPQLDAIYMELSQSELVTMTL
ncbi:MAG: DUF493 domain-containing protein [Gammaproteobacteria bacterium]|nr:DUF493 domain-containing protein [Gammaproteobacteria bacterium]